MSIDELADALHAIGYQWGTQALDWLERRLDGHPRYTGRHRAPTLLARTRARWAAARAALDAERARVVGLENWWAQRRADYAPAYARAAARLSAGELAWN